MNAEIKTIDGRLTLTVYYNPMLHNWDAAIAVGLASYGLKRHQVRIFAVPEKSTASHQEAQLNNRLSSDTET